MPSLFAWNENSEYYVFQTLIALCILVMNIKNERLAGSNLDGSKKIPACSTKKMTTAEIAELKKLLDASFKGVK